MKHTTDRKAQLMPAGIPRYVRIYDDPSTFDQYTCLYTGRRGTIRTNGRVWGQYRGMSVNPYAPQGFGQYGEMQGGHNDTKNGWPPKIGQSCHLGKRIAFADLPADCQRLVLDDYTQLWNL